MTPGRPGVRGYWQNLLARGSTHVRREHQELIREFLHEAGQDHPLDGGPYSPFPLTKSTVGFIELPGKPDQGSIVLSTTASPSGSVLPVRRG
jgi:hypothetical protein